MRTLFFTHTTPGEITGSGICQTEFLDQQGLNGDIAVAGEADPNKHYYLNGEVCSYTEAELLAKNSLPSGWIWQMPERIAVDARLLAATVTESVRSIDQLGDKARLAVVGDAARIKEYERAQAHAEQYRNAGFTGPVPSSVASWAKAKKWTAQAAAEDILAASTRWYAALDSIRDLRLNTKEDIKRAVSVTEVDNIVTAFKSSLLTMMQGVQ